MAKRISNLADLDIEQEGMAQQDGLAERLARQRGQQSAEPASQVVRPEAPVTATPQRQRAAAEPNSWRRGKALLQVACPKTSMSSYQSSQSGAGLPLAKSQKRHSTPGW